MMQENDSEWGFRVVVFLIKSCFFSKNPKMDIKNKKKQVGWVLLENGFFSTLITFQSFFVIFP